MITKIINGIGRPGKLWTGNTPSDGSIVNCRIIERKCSVCGKTTRKFRCEELQASKDVLEALDLPTTFITMGGVGSVYNYGEGNPGPHMGAPKHLRCWNWSERIGGHVIVNPILVMNGYVKREQLPNPKAGFRWVQTYNGSTLSEFVLIRDDHPGLEIISLEGKCPPCRRKEEIESIPETLMVSHEQFVSASGNEGWFTEVLRDLGVLDPEGTRSISARTLAGYAHYDGCFCKDVCLKAIDLAMQQQPAIAPNDDCTRLANG